MINFVPRTECPKSDNKYYIRGALNDSILGKPQTKGIPECLPNCVGYARGRFMEIQASIMQKLKPLPNGNPPTILKLAIEKGFEVSEIPTLGGAMIWADEKNNGHIAIVECINSDGSIITSDSAYNGKPFYTTKRTPPTYGASRGRTYKGCILNPIWHNVPKTETFYRVQLGAFKEYENAVKLQNDLKKLGYTNTIIVKVEK